MVKLSLTLKISLLSLTLIFSILILLKPADAKEPATIFIQQSDSSYVASPQPANEITPFSAFWKSLWLIAGFSMLLYLMLRLIKNVAYGRGFSGRSQAIKLVGTTAIGHKKALYIVQVLSHYLVLGVSDHDISLLLDIPEDSLSETSKEMLIQNKKAVDPRFKEVLRGWMSN